MHWTTVLPYIVIPTQVLQVKIIHSSLGTIKARPRSAVRAPNYAQYAVNRKYGVA